MADDIHILVKKDSQLMMKHPKSTSHPRRGVDDKRSS